MNVERINNTRKLVVLKSDDIVMARTFVISDKSQNKGVKLCYAIRGSYQIIRNTDHNSYYV